MEIEGVYSYRGHRIMKDHFRYEVAREYRFKTLKAAKAFIDNRIAEKEAKGEGR